MSQNIVEQTFTVTLPARLKVSNISGTVVITPGSSQPGNEIHITAIKRPGRGDADRTEIMLNQLQDGSVIAETRYDHGNIWGWLTGSYPCDVDYTIQVPAATSVTANGVSNSVAVQGLQGEFVLRSVSGEITLRELSGSMRINSVSGRIEAERLAGPLNAETVSGDVYAQKSSLPKVDVKTVSGGIDLETALESGPYNFNSVSGGVCLRVPPETRCSLELSSISGGIQTDFPVSSDYRSNGHRRAEVNGGGCPVRAHSVSGGVRIESTGPLPQHQTPAPPAPMDRREILERLERGEINAQEALQQLEH